MGRFTDPHPLTCSFFTSPFCWLMFWLCALPSALSKSVLLVEENSAFHRAQSHASIRCPCRPSWACFFLFLPIPQFFSATSLSGGEISFLSPGGWPLPPDSLTTGSHASNGAGNPSRWCRFPTLSPKPHKGPHRAEFWFSHQNELTPPPLGGGARYRLFGLLVFSRREARCFSAGKDGYFVSEGFSWQLPWQLLLTTGSHGSNEVGLGLCWCRSPPRPQNRTQGHTGPSLVSPPFSPGFFRR